MINWAWQLKNGGWRPMLGRKHFQNQEELVKGLEIELQKGTDENWRRTTTGAGNRGTGAV